MHTKETGKRCHGKRRGGRYKVLLIASLCTFAVLSSSLTGTVLMRRHEAENAAELAKLYHAPQSPGTQEVTVGVGAAFEIPERFRELYEINPDIIGWLRAGELADEPVVFRDNEFYLDHNFRCEDNGIGVVFADEKNTDWADAPYLVLYGHNIDGGIKFGKLWQYRDLEHLMENAVIEWDTVRFDEAKEYAVFAVFDASMLPDDENSFYLRRFDELRSSEAAGMQALIDEVRARSVINIPLTVDAQDRILVLVTCSHVYKDSRLLIFARELREGETAEGIHAVVGQSRNR